MMMRDRGDAGFDDKLRKGNTQRNVDGDRQGILHHENIELEAPVEFLQLVPELFFESVDGLGDGACAFFFVKQGVLNLKNVVVMEKRFGSQMGPFRIG